jgi:hypothetical protein
MILQRQNPGGDDAGALDACSTAEENGRKVTRTRPWLKVQVIGRNRMGFVHGRLAQTLWLLMNSGSKGLATHPQWVGRDERPTTFSN